VALLREPAAIRIDLRPEMPLARRKSLVTVSGIPSGQALSVRVPV
jgi:hypothetical protein